MDNRLILARRVALGYAGIVLVFQATNVASLAINAPEEWRKVVGHTVIGLVAAVIPLAALAIGRRFAGRPRAGRILAGTVIAACIVPFVVYVLLTFSSEPLALLGLLYVPPLQIILLATGLIATAFANRA